MTPMEQFRVGYGFISGRTLCVVLLVNYCIFGGYAVGRGPQTTGDSSADDPFASPNDSCGVSTTELETIAETMEQAAKELGQNEFTETPTDWNATCATIITFMQTKASYISKQATMLNGIRLVSPQLYESLAAELQKKVSYYNNLVNNLKHEHLQTVSNLERNFQTRLAELQASVQDLADKLLVEMEKSWKLRNDLVVLHLKHGNSKSALMSTDLAIRAVDLRSILARAYTDTDLGTNTEAIFNYVGGLQACNQTEVALSQSVISLQERGYLSGMNALYLVAASDRCSENSGINTILTSVKGNIEQALQSYVTKILNRDYTLTKTDLKKVEGVLGISFPIARKIVSMAVSEITKRGPRKDTTDQVEPILNLALDGGISCEDQAHAVDELLKSLDDSRLNFAYDFVLCALSYRKSYDGGGTSCKKAQALAMCLRNVHNYKDWKSTCLEVAMSTN